MAASPVFDAGYEYRKALTPNSKSEDTSRHISVLNFMLPLISNQVYPNLPANPTGIEEMLF